IEPRPAGRELRGPGARGDRRAGHEHARHAGGRRPCDHLVAVLVEAVVRQIDADIDQLHGASLPAGAPGGSGTWLWTGLSRLMTICDKQGSQMAGYYMDGRADEDRECRNNSACSTTSARPRSRRPESWSCAKAGAPAACS